MTNVNFKEALRVGRDPNNATWVTVRYVEDWAKGTLQHLIHDPTRGVVELEPMNGFSEEWLPLEPITDAEGTSYRSDPANHRILQKNACEKGFTPLAGVGGRGWETGRLHTPLGLSLDNRGWLYVADSQNHRVQVVRPEDGSIVAVLGLVDDWGRPITGDSAGAMREPVHAVVNPCTCDVYVADRTAGLIHVFDQRFEHVISFEPRTQEPPTLTPRPAGERPRPVAVAVLRDGSLLILDTTRPRLIHMTVDGRALTDLAAPSDTNPFSGGRSLKVRFFPEGEAVLGPLDGGTYDQKWHKVIIEADVPKGTSIAVQTYASNEINAPVESMPWAPPNPIVLPLAQVEKEGGTYQRLILSDVERWRRSQHGPFRRNQPTLHQFQGDGPSATDTVTLLGTTVGMLRVGDAVEFDKGDAIESLSVAAIANREVNFTATGNADTYGNGTRVLLQERNRELMPGGPRLLRSLQGGESIDLSMADVSGLPNQGTFPHSVAAFFLSGDVVIIENGGNQIRLFIESLPTQNVQVTFAPSIAGDFSSSVLRLVHTPGRLIVQDLKGFERHPVLHESITVTDSRGTAQANILLVETHHHAVWLEPGTLSPNVTFESWENFTTPEAQATDRGRYVWIRLVLNGRRERSSDDEAVQTPVIRSIRALLPRLSYLNYLPATYARRDTRNDPSGALFLERLLALFEDRLTHVEAAYESVSRLLNPEAADQEWLRFLSEWLGLVFDPSWPLERRRQLVLEAADLYKRRGTPASLQRYVEIYTGKRPELLEGFQWRPSSSLIVGRAGRVGCSPIGQASCNFTPYAHRFTLYVFLDEACDVVTQESSVRSIVESVKPAQVEFTLCFVLPHTKVGLQSTVGLDTVIGVPAPPTFVLGQGMASLAKRTHPVVGLDAVSGMRGTRRVSGGIQISQRGVRCDQSLTLQ